MTSSNYDEIRRVRAEMSAKAGHDIRRLIAMINEKRSDYSDRIINPGGEAEQSVAHGSHRQSFGADVATE